MNKTYHPKTIEESWYQTWEDNRYFVPQGQGLPYCIMIPPPNVTGTLHMGHGFQNSLMDALIRYHRMQGDKTLWQVGVDHAGIATQLVVENQLVQQGLTRHDLGRDAFVEKVWSWREQSGQTITQQLRHLGCSMDWSRERFTMDEGFTDAVQHTFVKLYREGLIYRGKRLVNWDPSLLTAISDLEVVAKEEKGHMYHIHYPLADGTGHLTVATTRPETLLADSAVAVHPDDPRYQALIGKQVQLPLTDRTIPIISDDYVDPEFGTGCLKITPGHDFNDYALGQRHHLPLMNIFTPNAHLNDQAPKAYQGLSRWAAREKIIADLTEQQLLEKTVDHTLKIPRGDRSGEVIEPYLTDQWFMHMKPLAEPAIEAVKKGDVVFVPENWTNTYYQWLENIEDWCISRQLWWGHRIPAWYDQNNHCYVGSDEASIRKRHQLGDDIQLTQDSDVLDTWFSSAIWPFATLGWPKKTSILKTFYPSQVLVTGFDIIFFWVARMIMLGLKFTGTVPFKEVYITGLIRDSFGQKMSKSKGNTLDPIDLIEGISLEDLIAKRTQQLMQPKQAEAIRKQTKKEFPEGIASHGTDALRFTYCALASTGRDIRFDMNRLAGYRNFCNKLWNASRFVLQNTEGDDSDFGDGPIKLSVADHWILSKLQRTIAEVHRHFQHYRFDLLTQVLHDFVWHEYCDWYLELAKSTLYSTTAPAPEKRGARATLLQVLEVLLRLLHPIIPFITEEIWQQVKPHTQASGDTIMLRNYPTVLTDYLNDPAEKNIAWLKRIVTAIRNIRSDLNMSLGKQIMIYCRHYSEKEKEQLEQYLLYLHSLAKVNTVTFIEPNQPIEKTVTALIDELEIGIPIAPYIDLDSQIQRLGKNLTDTEKALEQVNRKLKNPNFLDKAPKPVVEEQQRKQVELKELASQLTQQLTQLSDGNRL